MEVKPAVADRELQRRLLAQLAEKYPTDVQASALGFGQLDKPFVQAISYLEEHGLVRANTTSHLDLEGGKLVMSARITARGIDFLADDGGLSAILNVLTVRFDAETIRALIGERIDAAPLPPEEKSKLKAWLSSAGSEVLKEATKRLVVAALDQAPQALLLLQTLRG